MADKTNKFTTQVMMEYNKQMNKLGKVSDDYVNNTSDKELARENLLKVYRAYQIFGYSVGIGLMFLIFFLAIVYKNGLLMVLLPLGYLLPLAFQWSSGKVMRITKHEYGQWLADKKAAKKSKKNQA